MRALSHPESHVQGENLVKTVISLGHTLGFSVLAEGVETEAQLDFLKLHGCDEMQGFLVSRPLPAEQVADFLLGRMTPQRSGPQNGDSHAVDRMAVAELARNG